MDNANFEKAEFFSCATFFKSVFFSNALFLDAKFFNCPATFNGAIFKNAAYFKKTRFELPPRFHNVDLHQDTSFHRAISIHKVGDEDDVRAWRTLKLAMNKIHNHKEADYRLEGLPTKGITWGGHQDEAGGEGVIILYRHPI